MTKAQLMEQLRDFGTENTKRYERILELEALVTRLRAERDLANDARLDRRSLLNKREGRLIGAVVGALGCYVIATLVNLAMWWLR